MNTLLQTTIILLLLSVGTAVTAQPTFSWVNSGGNSNTYEGACVATDNNYNVYLGMNNNYSGSFNSDFEVKKYDSDGNLLWVKAFGGTAYDYIRAIEVDNDGNIIIAGSFNAQVMFGSYQLVASTSYYDMFVAKLNPQGDVIWATRGGSTRQGGAHSDEDGVYDLAIDGSNNIYMTGWFIDTADYGGITVTSHGDSDFFVAKMNTNGGFEWVRNGGTYLATACAMGDRETGRRIVVDDEGNVYVTGRTAGYTIYADNLVVPGNPLSYIFDVFYAKYNTDGVIQWLKSVNSTQNEEGYGIAVWGNNLYVTGYNQGTLNFGFDSTLNNTPDVGTFIIKCNKSDGTPTDMVSLSGTESVFVADMAADDLGNIYLTGKFNGTCNFGGTSLSSPNMSPDLYITSYDKDLNQRWIKKAGGTSQDYPLALTLFNNRDVIISGMSDQNAAFDSQTATYGFFVARMRDAANPSAINNIATIPTNVYPNPTSGIVSITANVSAEENYRVVLTDVTGRLIFDKSFEGADLTSGINLQINEPAGVYLLAIKGSNTSSFSKLIMQ